MYLLSWSWRTEVRGCHVTPCTVTHLHKSGEKVTGNIILTFFAVKVLKKLKNNHTKNLSCVFTAARSLTCRPHVAAQVDISQRMLIVVDWLWLLLHYSSTLFHFKCLRCTFTSCCLNLLKSICNNGNKVNSS